MHYGGISLLVIWLVYILAGLGLFSQFEFDLAVDVISQPYILNIIRFTFFQAILSTLISLGLAIPVARALHRQHFIGKQLLLILSGLCLVIPVIVAILGIVAIHGGHGWVSALFDIDIDYLYSLTGILIAHVFFNLPLAVRVLLHSLYTLPDSSWRLAGQLDLNSWQVFKFIEWPLFKNQLPATAGLIFMLCFTSFAVVLVLGGGLKYSTLEVAIYQSLRIDFDISRAVVLALLQIAVCLLVFVLLIRFSSQFSLQTLSIRPVTRYDGQGRLSRWVDFLLLIIFIFWVIAPILAILIKGMTSSHWSIIMSPGFIRAMLCSLIVCLACGSIAGLLILGLGYLAKQFAQRQRGSTFNTILLESTIQLSLIFPAFVLATGLFVQFKANTAIAGPVIVVVINVLAILPFMMRVILPAVLSTHKHDRLSSALGITGISRLRIIDWPLLRKPFAWSLGIGMALAVGDFSVIALFGTQDFVTLPLYMYRLMGAYKMDQAAVVAVVICILCLFMFYSCNRFIGNRAGT